MPAIEFALAWLLSGREPGGAGAGLPMGSPPRSEKVLRFRTFEGGGIAIVRAFVAEADISDNLPGEWILLGGRKCEVNYIIVISYAPREQKSLESLPNSRYDDPLRQFVSRIEE